jgi:hypothetical protein
VRSMRMGGLATSRRREEDAAVDFLGIFCTASGWLA